MADEKAPSAQFEISIDGKPRSHRDRKDIAIETAEYLKRKFPNCDVVVKDLRSGEAFAEFQNWPYEAISQIASPDDAQRSTLEALRASTTAAAERLSADCPQDEPAPSGERLVAAEQAIDTVTSSYAAVEPPLRAFFAALDDEQKARLLRGLSSLRPRASPPAPPGSSFEPVARVRSPARGT
jgi:hypothetical protein